VFLRTKVEARPAAVAVAVTDSVATRTSEDILAGSVQAPLVIPIKNAKLLIGAESYSLAAGAAACAAPLDSPPCAVFDPSLLIVVYNFNLQRSY
jgi:hypothetical protein